MLHPVFKYIGSSGKVVWVRAADQGDAQSDCNPDEMGGAIKAATMSSFGQNCFGVWLITKLGMSSKRCLNQGILGERQLGRKSMCTKYCSHTSCGAAGTISACQDSAWEACLIPSTIAGLCAESQNPFNEMGSCKVIRKGDGETCAWDYGLQPKVRTPS